MPPRPAAELGSPGAVCGSGDARGTIPQHMAGAAMQLARRPRRSRPRASIRLRVLLGSLAVALAASGASAAERSPRFIKRLIRQFESAPKESSPGAIVRYEYRGGPVYYIPIPAYLCCDIPSKLYDSRGALICAPDGGFTGRGDGKCPDFMAQRSGETLIWNDARLEQAPLDPANDPRAQ
jgi:uncharacterized protein DUF6970